MSKSQLFFRNIYERKEKDKSKNVEKQKKPHGNAVWFSISFISRAYPG
jgi:hypothetical protein